MHAQIIHSKYTPNIYIAMFLVEVESGGEIGLLVLDETDIYRFMDATERLGRILATFSTQHLLPAHFDGHPAVSR